MTDTIRDCLHKARQLIDSDSPRLDVELLLAHVLDKDRAYLFTWPERSLSSQQLAQFDELLAQRRGGRPVAHLLGQREFWGLSLAVNDTTLIPRPDTETLIEAALQLDLPAGIQALDLGTGTGAIALALASERPDWQLLGVDVSPGAVALAQQNAQRLKLTHVRFAVSDWFAGVPAAGYHLIASNPPYIDAGDPHLQQGDLRFEPASALVAPEQGLADLRYIIDRSREYLRPGGWLLLEHGYDQGRAVRQCLVEQGYGAVRTLPDLGGNERVTLGQWAESTDR